VVGNAKLGSVSDKWETYVELSVAPTDISWHVVAPNRQLIIRS
jgi:hypothetical protein